MLRRCLCALVLVGFAPSWVCAWEESTIVVVDITGFHAEHVLRGRRVAEEEIRTEKLGFYVGVCWFPGLSEADSRKLNRKKKYLEQIGVPPREYDQCNDLIDEAQRVAAFVEGYNAVSRVEILRRTGKSLEF